MCGGVREKKRNCRQRSGEMGIRPGLEWEEEKEKEEEGGTDAFMGRRPR